MGWSIDSAGLRPGAFVGTGTPDDQRERLWQGNPVQPVIAAFGVDDLDHAAPIVLADDDLLRSNHHCDVHPSPSVGYRPNAA